MKAIRFLDRSWYPPKFMVGSVTISFPHKDDSNVMKSNNLVWNRVGPIFNPIFIYLCGWSYIEPYEID